MKGMPGSAGVVLAGGRSSRMGTPKAALEWHGSTLLRRTVGILARATGGPVVVVRAKGQDLPELPKYVEVIDDPHENKGPVQGIAAGLAALHDRADVGLPVARGYPQPLAAAYRTKLAVIADRLVQENRLRPAFLFEQCAVSRLDEAALTEDPVLAALDPALESVVNVIEPDDYRTARDKPAPLITVQRFGVLASGPDGHSQPQTVHAATVAEAAAAAGVDFTGGHVTAALNGDQITRDGQTPLAAGDTVFFLSADAGG